MWFCKKTESEPWLIRTALFISQKACMPFIISQTPMQWVVEACKPLSYRRAGSVAGLPLLGWLHWLAALVASRLWLCRTECLCLKTLKIQHRISQKMTNFWNVLSKNCNKNEIGAVQRFSNRVDLEKSFKHACQRVFGRENRRRYSRERASQSFGFHLILTPPRDLIST